MSPVDLAGGYPGADELALQEELDDLPLAEGTAVSTEQERHGFHRKNAPLVW
jgi:hypothetical protein